MGKFFEVRGFRAPNGTMVKVYSDGRKEFVTVSKIAKALGYSGFNFAESLFSVLFKNHQFAIYTKPICARRGSGTVYVMEYNQLIPFLESFIRATLIKSPINKYQVSVRDNARMEAQALIELLNSEKDPVATLSKELVTFLEKEYDDYPVKTTELSNGVIKTLSSLEKECGSANVINAIRTESIISSCEVVDCLTGDGSEGVWEYIFDFARHPDAHSLTGPAEVIKSVHRDCTDADIRFYIAGPGYVFIPRIDLAKGLCGSYRDYVINCIQEAADEARVPCKVIQIAGGNFEEVYFADDVFNIFDKYASLPNTTSGEAWHALDLWGTLNETLQQIKKENSCTQTEEETQMESSTTTITENNVHAVSVEDIEDIGNRVKATITVFRVAEKDALRAVTKLKAEEINRDLSPLIELLD